MSDTRLLLRGSVWGRLYVLLFATIWTSSLIVLTAKMKNIDLAQLAASGFGVLFCIVFAYRAFREELRLDGEQLLVRNFSRTRRLQRQDIRRIWIGPPVTAPLPGGWISPIGETINIEPQQGKAFAVDVTHHILGLAEKRDRLKAAQQTLTEWAAAP